MNEKIIRPGIIQRMFELTQSKGQKYGKDEISNILTAFFDVIETELSKGNSVVLKGCMIVEPIHRKEKTIYCASQNKHITISEQYRANVKLGSKLVNAARKYSEKTFGGTNG